MAKLMIAGKRRLPVRRYTVQALRNARSIEEIAHDTDFLFHLSS